jgi:uroporphyrin-III C-methyltransferase
VTGEATTSGTSTGGVSGGQGSASDAPGPASSSTPAAAGDGLSTGASDASVSRHSLSLDERPQGAPGRGRIILLGSGPGSPSLLTVAAHDLLTRTATLVLSDKLVPAAILDLIPRHIPLVIAKKFPGNAEGAQNELMDRAVEAAKNGHVVVRLKQGDPFVYGRGGEEVLHFRAHGFESVVVPGISSALAAPTMAGIPVTQRGVSLSLTLCTGVGREGRAVRLPGYERSRTLVVLMGVARLPSVVRALTSAEDDAEGGQGREGNGERYPPYTPIAIIERASSADQRIVASTLDRIVDAMERAGEQRPPGMMVIGWSVLALDGAGDMEVLDGEPSESADRARVERWLGGRTWIEKDGLPEGWDQIDQAVRDASLSA